jgi:hypothetical protein
MDTSRLPGGSTPAIRTMHLTELKGRGQTGAVAAERRAPEAGKASEQG